MNEVCIQYECEFDIEGFGRSCGTVSILFQEVRFESSMRKLSRTATQDFTRFVCPI